MSDNLENFIGKFNGGNRTHRYDVDMSLPSGINDEGQNSRFFIRAVSLPPSQINPIRIPYRGRLLKWPGDRIYFPWTFRVLDQNEGDNKSLWNSFNEWSNRINDNKENTSNQDWGSFTSDWTIKQIGYDGGATKTITLFDCWPTIVGPISMDANSIDTLVEFTVTVEYTYHTVAGT
tara:strand:+ start:1569 stop:2096 length:528 start_codon:yes stop_codon:yes gene_type:complete